MLGGEGTMAEPKRPGAFEEFDARLGKARPEKKGAGGGGDEPPPRLDYGTGLQAGIEVVAGVGFGVLLGWALDRWLGTMPLFLIVFFMLGAAAGVLNAYRHLRRMQDGA
jgi:ATP synthase protein I